MGMVERSDIDRRTFLGGAGLATAGVGLTLAGCSAAPDEGSQFGVKGDGVVLPVHREPDGLPTPDFPGIPGRLAPGYLSYPADPPSLATSGPASGGTITAAYSISGATPPPVDRNTYWQAINKELNTDFQATLIPSAEWGAKFATLVAGEQLPDLVRTSSDSYPRLPELLEARFTDLTEYVSGEAILDYPNLANMPTESWKGCVFNGKIFAVPQSKEPMPSVIFMRKDLAEDLDIPTAWSSFDEFSEICGEITSAQANRWAIGSVDGAIQHVMSMLGTPNSWAEADGRFTAQVETEEYRQCLSAVAQLWKDGVFHPDALAGTTADGKQWLVSGACLLHWDSMMAWSDDVFKSARLAAKLAVVPPPGFSGGKGTSSISKPWSSLQLISKTDPDRVRELLRVLDYLYAPFGSSEYLLKIYGVEGVDFNFEDGQPVQTSQGITQTALMMRYVGTPPVVTYEPGQEEVTKARYDYGTSIQDVIVDDPTVGLVSQTAQMKAAELNALIKDISFDVVSGKSDIAELDEVVDQWRTQGGDAVRNEYEQALQELA